MGGVMEADFRALFIRTNPSEPVSYTHLVDSYEFAQYWNAGCINAGSPRLYSEEKMGLLQQYIKDPSSCLLYTSTGGSILCQPLFLPELWDSFFLAGKIIADG